MFSNVKTILTLDDAHAIMRPLIVNNAFKLIEQNFTEIWAIQIDDSKY